jgi:hypothetical protein
MDRQKNATVGKLKWRRLNAFDFFLETFRFPIELPCFSNPRWTTHLQISHATRRNVYLSKDTKLEVSLRECACEHHIKPQNSD